MGKLELQRRDVQDIKTALRVVESLIEYQKIEGSKDKGRKPSLDKNGGDKGKYPKATTEVGTSPRKKSKGDKSKISDGFFLCGGSHLARNCQLAQSWPPWPKS